MTQGDLFPSGRIVKAPCLYEKHCGRKGQVVRVDWGEACVNETVQCLSCPKGAVISWTREAWTQTHGGAA